MKSFILNTKGIIFVQNSSNNFRKKNPHFKAFTYKEFPEGLSLAK